MTHSSEVILPPCPEVSCLHICMMELLLGRLPSRVGYNLLLSLILRSWENVFLAEGKTNTKAYGEASWSCCRTVKGLADRNGHSVEGVRRAGVGRTGHIFLWFLLL